MVHEASARPLRALERTRLLDGTPLGTPKAAEGNPLLEEVGFERLVTFDADKTSTEQGYPNATLDGAEEAREHSEHTPREPDAPQLPRVAANALTRLIENDARCNPEDGDESFYEVQRAANVAAGEDRTVLDIKIDPGDELYVTSIGTDAVEGQDQVEVVTDGDLEYRKLFSPMTLSEARSGRCFDPPLRARKSIQVKVKNNGAVAATLTANLRGWTRPLTSGTIGEAPPRSSTR